MEDPSIPTCSASREEWDVQDGSLPEGRLPVLGIPEEPSPAPCLSSLCLCLRYFHPLVLISLPSITSQWNALGTRFGKASWAACAQLRGDGVWDGRNHAVEAAPEGISAPACWEEPGCPTQPALLQLLRQNPAINPGPRDYPSAPDWSRSIPGMISSGSSPGPAAFPC